MDYALNWGMLSCYLTNFEVTKGRECVIVKATHGISKSKEPLYRFREHSSTV